MGRSDRVKGKKRSMAAALIQKAKKSKPGMLLSLSSFLWQVLCFTCQSRYFSVRLYNVMLLHRVCLARQTYLLLAETASASLCNRKCFSFQFSGFPQALFSWSTELLPDSGVLKDLEKDFHIELVSDMGLGRECWRCNACAGKNGPIVGDSWSGALKHLVSNGHVAKTTVPLPQGEQLLPAFMIFSRSCSLFSNHEVS